MDLLVLQACDARQLQTLEELQRSAAAGRDVGHLISKAQLLNSSCGVAAADDGNSLALSDCLGNSLGADCEGVKLEYVVKK